MNPDPLVPLGDGDTILGPDDVEGLKLSYVTTRGELNDAEAANVAAALNRRVPSPGRLLDHLYLRRLHTAMFGDVWSWAGRYRTRGTNIGIDPASISEAVVNLTADARLWVAGDEPPDVVAARFHHRLVWIHPFVNGNGRHGRAAADLLLRGLGHRPFSWGAGTLGSTGEMRARYLSALRAMDRKHDDSEGLVAFARS